MDELEYEGSKIRLNDDGSTVVEVKTGTILTMDKDGHTHINLNNIKSIGIYNIVDLKTHHVLHEGDISTHEIEFQDGGTAKFGYNNKTGQLVEFSTVKASLTITKENEIMLKKYEPADLPSKRK